MLTRDFLTKSIFLPHEHDLIRASEHVGLVYHSSRSFLRSWRRKKKKRSMKSCEAGWLHISGRSRLICCPAGCLRGSVHSGNTWPAPPSGSHYRVSLSTALFHPLWQKWQTHFFVHVHVSLHLSSRGRKSDCMTMHRLGGFLSSKQQLMNGFKWKVVVKA